MSRTVVREIDHGWDRIKRSFVASKHIALGVLADNAARKEGDEFDNVAIATVHEFGSEDGKIPQRSFLRATIEKNRRSYVLLAKELYKKVITIGMPYEMALRLFAEKAKGDVVQRINEGIEPALSERTIEKKGSSKPLIDTAQLKQSINYEIRRGKA